MGLLTVLWSFERDAVLAPWGMNLALLGRVSMAGLMGRLSLVGVDAVWQLGLGCLLVGAVAGFLRCTGYLGFMGGPMGRVLLLVLVRVRLLGCLFFWLLASLRLGAVSLNIAQLFMKGTVKKLFWFIKGSGEILGELRSGDFLASGLSTYGFSTLCATLPHSLIKGKLAE